MCAGLTDVSDGGITLDGREVTSAGPDRGVVFQAPNPAVVLTARQNVARASTASIHTRRTAERSDIVDYYLTPRGARGFARQTRARHVERHAPARRAWPVPFALSPKLLLLDEPFGNAGCVTRWDLQEVLMDILKRTKIPATASRTTSTKPSWLPIA
jgi:nitrate/nitrite transport system ATP-binding protein